MRVVGRYLPSKSPRPSPIEPKWAHAERRAVEPARRLNAQGFIDRVCAAFDCPHDPHLDIAGNAA